jgi:TolB-like protein
VEILEKIKPSPEKPKTRKIIPYVLLGGIITIIVVAIIIWNNLSEKPSDRDVSQAGNSPEKSLAVIPFRNDSPNPENEEWFCNGMLEDILNGLFKIGDLKVLSRIDVEPYRDTTLTRPEIARALGVTYLIEGSVRKMGNRFRMTIQLIDPETGFHLWSNPYEGELSEDPTLIFQIQSNIAEEIASALNIILTSDEKQRIDHIPTTNLEAYKLWARGRQEMSVAYWSKPEIRNQRTNLALDLFNEALALDPEYPDALAAKGEVFSHSRERYYDSTIYYCNRAMELNPEYSGAYWIRGFAYEMMQEYDLALKDYFKVVELTPNHHSVYMGLFRIYFRHKKDYLKAWISVNKYIEEEPLQGHDDAGHLYGHIGEYEKAEYHFYKLIQSEHLYWPIHYYCHTLGVQGKHQEVLNFLDSISESFCNRSEEYKYLCYWKKWIYSVLLKEFELADNYYNLLVDSAGGIRGFWSEDSIKLAYMYRNLGRDSLAEITLDKIRRSFEYMLRTNPKGHYPLIAMPSIYALLDDKKKAISYLSEIIEQEYVVGGIQDELKNSPLYENLWGDPEFEALVKRMQEDKAAIRAQIREMEKRGEINL